MSTNEKRAQDNQTQGDASDGRPAYEKPELRKKRSVARVTLFSGSGASGASGLTSA